MSRAWEYGAAVLAGALLGPSFGPAGSSAAAQQVTLPLAKFEQLREQARTIPEPPPPPPAPFALTSDEIEIVAGPAAARVVQVLTVRLLGAGWQSVALGDTGSFVGADLGGLEGGVADAAGGKVLQVRGQGEHRVRLESVVAMARDETATRPTWRCSLRPPAAAVVRGVLRLAPPLAGTVEEAVLGDGTLPGGARQGDSWTFAAVPGQQLQVRLLGRAVLPERARLPLRFEATAATAAVLSRTRLRVHGWVVARIAQGRLAELRLRLPEGFTVESVAAGAGGIAGWKTEHDSLVVTPLEPVEGSLQLAVELTGPPRDAFPAPLLLPQGTSRARLLARAVLQGDGLLELVDAGATRPPDAVEAAPLAADPAKPGGKLYLVADASRPPRWQAAWADRTEVLAAQIDDLWVEVAAGEAGRAAYQLWAEVRNRGTTQLELGLPPGFELVVASRDGMPLAPGLAAGQRLTVPLLSREAPQLVHLAGVLPLALPPGGGHLAVPLPSMSAPAARVHARLLLPGGRDYALVDGTRASGAEAPPRPAATAMAAPPSSPQGDLAGQMLLRPEEDPNGDAAAPLPAPEGCAVVAASWSALSSSPAPLLLKVTPRKEDEPWL
jgi:hypothetical protein